MSTCCGQNTPQFPSTITVNNTTIEIDGAEIEHTCEIIDFEGGTEGVLTYTPNSAMPFHVYRNGVRYRPTTDYTRSGSTVTLTFTPREEDVFMICYWYAPEEGGGEG